MFIDFVNKLIPINDYEIDEWNEIKDIYKQNFKNKEPVLFWYLSSGFDTKALVHFNNKDTSEVYRTPNVDIFIYSDYNYCNLGLFEKYEELDYGGICLYEDRKTYVELEQMIPLKYFNREEVIEIKNKYSIQYPKYINIIDDEIHFWFLLISIESNYFGQQYFPIVFAQMENWVLMNEIWNKKGVFFDYICGVCDGCRKGGAHKCVNKAYKEFLPVMKKNCYWVSDHIHYFASNNNKNDFIWSFEFDGNRFERIGILNGWGYYNYDSNTSYLYKIIRR